MRNLVALTLLFIAVVIINSVAVYAQRRFKFYSRLFGKYDWAIHAILLTIIWIGFLLAVVLAKLPNWSLPSTLRPLGIVAAAAGIWLVFESWTKLGTAGVFNGWFFGRGLTKQLQGGIFRLRNPMYTGFILLFVSAAFWLENAAYLWLAASSFVLLNIIQSRIERPTKDNFKKEMKVLGINLLDPKALASLFIVATLMTALAIYSLRGPEDMSSKNMGMSDMETQTTPAMKQMFVKLAAAHTDVCGDIGNKSAIDKYMSGLPSGSRLQGSCCSPMDMKKYFSQIKALKKYANIPQIPADPYDVSVTSAKQMLGYYDSIQLTPAQQRIYDSAQKMTDDKGWCCCQCWAWYTHAGLAKYLITQHNFTVQQIVAITNLEDCCGGS